VNSITKLLKLYYDNSLMLFITNNKKSKSQSKHIVINYLAKVIIEYVITKLMILNHFIKDMSLKKFKDHVTHIWDLVPYCDKLLILL